jgi:hypothetical protein
MLATIHQTKKTSVRVAAKGAMLKHSRAIFSTRSGMRRMLGFTGHSYVSLA